jgi:two-component system NarL family response regulator
MKVLLADDHPLFLDALRNLLESRGIEVSGSARDGFAAVELARALRPEVVLMDIQMPGLDGLAALRQIKAELPAIKIIMLTMSAEDEDLFEAVKGGATGYLLKTRDSEEFFELLEDVERGEVALSPGLAARILREFGRLAPAPQPADAGEPSQSLTERQVKILALVADGFTYKEVGAQLSITERTIKYHMAEIVERLHAGNRREAIESARRAGLIRKPGA